MAGVMEIGTLAGGMSLFSRHPKEGVRNFGRLLSTAYSMFDAFHAHPVCT